MAIGYHNLTLGNIQFYWHSSVIFYRDPEHGWQPLAVGGWGTGTCEEDFMTTEEYDHMKLEEISNPMVRLNHSSRGSDYPAQYVHPRELFDSEDFITYRPQLGYLIVGDELWWIEYPARRERYKGLQRDLSYYECLALGRLWTDASLSGGVSWQKIVMALCERMEFRAGYYNPDDAEGKSLANQAYDLLLPDTPNILVMSPTTALAKLANDRISLFLDGKEVAILMYDHTGHVSVHWGQINNPDLTKALLNRTLWNLGVRDNG